MKRIILSVIAFLLVGYAFSQTDTSGRTLYRATAEKKTALKHTKLKVSFNFDNQTLNGEEWLTAAPYFYPTDSLILNAKSMLIQLIRKMRIILSTLNIQHSLKKYLIRALLQ